MKFVEKSHHLERRGRKALRSYGRRFRDQNLYSRVTVFSTLSPISFFFCPIKSFQLFFKLKSIICTLLLCDNNVGHHARLKEKGHLYRYRA